MSNSDDTLKIKRQELHQVAREAATMQDPRSLDKLAEKLVAHIDAAVLSKSGDPELDAVELQIKIAVETRDVTLLKSALKQLHGLKLLKFELVKFMRRLAGSIDLKVMRDMLVN